MLLWFFLRLKELQVGIIKRVMICKMPLKSTCAGQRESQPSMTQNNIYIAAQVALNIFFSISFFLAYQIK
jgi:hypothetical protein